MKTLTMPGFTSESSVSQSQTRYRTLGANVGHQRVGEVVPQLATECSGCSDFFRGKRYCCDIIVTCDPYGGCTDFERCYEEDCGLLTWLDGLLRGFQ